MKKKFITKIAIGLSMSLITVSCIGMYLMQNKNVSSADNDNTRIEFKIHTTAADKASIHLVNNAIFDEKYFYEKSTIYNNSLAQLSIQMSLAAATTAGTVNDYGEDLEETASVDSEKIDGTKTRNAYLARAYKSMGFENDVYYKYEVNLNDDSNKAAHGIASKKITIDGQPYTLVNISLRSAAYGSEWASNFTLKNEKNMSGFNAAAADVYTHFREYIRKYNLGKNTKVWINGFSRGAAVANITAAYIDRACESGEIKIDRDNVYAYTFATPNGIIDENETEVRKPLYDNIHNIIYEADIVPTMAPKIWGFKRFGKEYIIPGVHIAGSDLDRIEMGYEPVSIKVTDRDVEIVKSVSASYNRIRYGYSDEIHKKFKDNLFRGFAVKQEFVDETEKLLSVFGNTVNEYRVGWQNVITDILPFAINAGRQYNEEKDTWERYTNLKEYMIDRTGEEVFEEAIETGVYSEEEHEEKVEAIEQLENKGAIDEKSEELLTTAVDTYYAVKVAASNYDITKEEIEETANKLYSEAETILKAAYPISDAVYCADNHLAEFYLALLRNYDVTTGQYFFEQVEMVVSE